jgi:anti-sigma factor (TIGR02949 family)
MSTDEIISCEDALRWLASYVDRELDDAAHAEMQRHLARCRSCYSRAEFEQRLKASVAALGREPVWAEFVARVQTLISRFAVAGEEPHR